MSDVFSDNVPHTPPADTRQVAGFYIDLTAGFPEMRIIYQGDQQAPTLTSDLIARIAATVDVHALEQEALNEHGLTGTGTVGERTLSKIVSGLHAHLHEHQQAASG